MAVDLTNQTMFRRFIQPGLVASVVGLALAGWVVIALWQQAIDRNLPSSVIQAQRLRVDQAQLNILQTTLHDYHHPAVVTKVSGNPFGS